MPISRKVNEKARVLLGWMEEDYLIKLVENNCTDAEIERLDEILEKHKKASKKVQKMEEEFEDSPEKITLKDFGPETNRRLMELEKGILFQKNFGRVPHEFKLVELEKTITLQPLVYLNYAAAMAKGFNSPPDEKNLIDVCLSLKNPPSPVIGNKINNQTFLFESDDDNLKFLGATIKDIDELDASYIQMGYPTKAVIAFVGYSSPQMQAVLAKKRVYLENGFHRAFAFYSKGVKFVPMLVKKTNNPELDFPKKFLNVPKETFLSLKRPPMLTDFFDDDLTIDLEIKPRKKIVRLSLNPEYFAPFSCDIGIIKCVPD